MSRHMLNALVAVGLAGCLGGAPTTMQPTGNDPTSTPVVGDSPTAGGVGNTFNHPQDERDPFDILQQKQEEGPATVSTRLHSCQKMSYATLGHLLASRGVDLNATSQDGQPPTAGELYRSGASALGAPNYLARTREPTQATAAGATKLMDVFVQAAPEIIAAMPNLDACKVDGQPAQMFDGNGNCTLAGVSCLIGAPATPQHVTLCNHLIAEASSPDIGRNMAVGVILAAAHTCE